MNQKQYHTIYMRKYRSNVVNRKRENKRDNEYKKRKRRTDPEWLERERVRRRVYGKINRYRNKEKDRINREKYLKLNRIKNQARMAIMQAVQKGKIKRPKKCESCRQEPEYLFDKRAKSGKRYPLRADHYKGYEKKNWLIVRWICKDCDGKQLRSKSKLVTT